MGFLDTVLILGHQFVIHFPIIGITMGFIAGLTALGLGVFRDFLNSAREMTEEDNPELLSLSIKFEFLSFALLIMGLVGLVFAAITGINAAGSLDNAISEELLEFKVRLSMYLFFILFTPIVLKIYFGLAYNENVFSCGSKTIPLLYLIPVFVAAILTLLVSSAGGQYVYGYNLIDLLGLEGIIPK